MDSLLPLLWFVVILGLIPAALWLLKRSKLVPAAKESATVKTLGVHALSAQQRIVTVEVGQGDQRRWLVLGVTPAQITHLHTLMPDDEPVSERLL